MSFSIETVPVKVLRTDDGTNGPYSEEYWGPYEEAMQYVEGMLGENMVRLGSGVYGTVYGASDVDFVVKIGSFWSDHTDGYMEYMKCIRGISGKNRWVPVIYGMGVFREHGQAQVKGHHVNGCFVVLMERLQDAEVDLSTVRYQEWMAIQGLLEEGDSIEESEALGAGADKYAKGELQELVDTLHRGGHLMLEDGRIGWDLHSGNVMARGQQLVLTDPWV